MAFKVKELSITLTSEEGVVWLLAPGCGPSIRADKKSCGDTQKPCSDPPLADELEILLQDLQKHIDGFQAAAALFRETTESNLVEEEEEIEEI